MGFWLKPYPGNEGKTRLVSGETQCIDTQPTEEGWIEAVEVRPDLRPHEQYHGAHYFDMTKTPAEICWPVVDYTPEEIAAVKAQVLKQENKVVQDQIDALELKGIRAIREGDAVRIATNDAAIAALRSQLKASL